MPKHLATLAALLALSLATAQGLPDPFLREAPPPPAPAEGDPAIQEEFLPPPGVTGAALRPYPLAPMVLSLPSEAPLLDFDPVPGLNLELTVAAPRPEPEPEPAPALAAGDEPRPATAGPSAEDQRQQPLESLAVAAEEPAPDFTLLALVTGSRPLAVVSVGGAVHRLTLGDTLPASNYIVEDIHPLKLVISGAGRTITVPLE